MSCPTGPMICIYRGDTYETVLNVTSGGSPLNITGYTITFAAQKEPTQAATDIEVTATINDAPGGIATISLSSTNTDVEVTSYTYDVEFRNSGDTIVQTYQGMLKIEQDVKP